MSVVEEKKAYPIRLNLLKIPSGEDTIIGRMFIAEGEGSHPTVLLLHGFPGAMMNLDLAAELQQNGWNVLVINYRGAWGSQGNFSYTSSLEDVEASLQYIKQPDVSKENAIDCERLALIGHSFGGFLALKVASLDPSIRVVASLSGANFGLFAQMAAQDPAFEAQIVELLEEDCFFLNGASAEAIMQEVNAHQNDWNTFLFSPLLADRHLLLTAATFDEDLPKPHFYDPLVSILEEAGAKQLQCQTFETDHNYTDKRKDLANALNTWLTEVLG